jgi:head-tail adaptor
MDFTDVQSDFTNVVDTDLVYGMTQSLTVQVAGYAKDTGGATEPTWADVEVVLGRVQAISSQEGAENEAMRTQRIATVWLPSTLALDENKRYRVLDEDARAWSLVSWTPTDRLGRPIVAQAERVPWPLS